MHLGVALEDCLRSVDRPHLPSLLLHGVVAGLARLGRVRVPKVGEDEITGIAAEAVEWTLSICSRLTHDAELRIVPNLPDRRGPPPGAGRLQNRNWAGSLGDDREMILAAAFRIAKSGCHQLSVPRVCREAGVSRRDFNRHFGGLEDCLSSALELRVGRALATWECSGSELLPWTGGVHRALEMLECAVGGDIGDARLLLTETSAAGTTGVDSRDHLITKIARTLRDTAPEGRKPSELEAEASTAAAWAILGSQVATRTARRGKRLPSTKR
jgi:AcrR family transcriptional regulator